MPSKRDQTMDRGPRKFAFETDNQRGRNMRNLDPYVLDEGMAEPASCSVCHATYRNKRWYAEGKAPQESAAEEEIKHVVCPACRKIAEKYPEGVVTLRGDYLWDHEEEIRNILRNEETKARAKNPLERIIRMNREGDQLVIETTEEKLAEHLGRALHKAHQGDLNITWDQHHDLCRVSWERML